VVAAERSAVSETCGDAALLVDPDEPDAIAEALVRVCEDDDLRARLVRAGNARAAELTWDRTARQMDAVLAGMS
jgi:glycosyltransferase involved in cell wall biosynthesis